MHIPKCYTASYLCSIQYCPFWIDCQRFLAERIWNLSVNIHDSLYRLSIKLSKTLYFPFSLVFALILQMLLFLSFFAIHVMLLRKRFRRGPSIPPFWPTSVLALLWNLEPCKAFSGSIWSNCFTVTPAELSKGPNSLTLARAKIFWQARNNAFCHAPSVSFHMILLSCPSNESAAVFQNQCNFWHEKPCDPFFLHPSATPNEGTRAHWMFLSPVPCLYLYYWPNWKILMHRMYCTLL